jgi:hypothetical protein
MSKIITSSQEECIDTQQEDMDTPQDAEIYEYEYEEDEEVSSPYDINDDAYWDVYFEPLPFMQYPVNNNTGK